MLSVSAFPTFVRVGGYSGERGTSRAAARYPSGLRIQPRQEQLSDKDNIKTKAKSKTND